LSYRVRTTGGHDGNALTLEIATEAGSERLDRDPVADPFDEHNCTRVHGANV
jgi:hypothetical protein